MSGAWTLTQGLLRNPLGSLGLCLTLLVVLGGLFAPLIAPYDPLWQDILARLSAPTAQHWLGTDQFGRDVLSRILFGIRASLGVAGLSVAIALLTGSLLGISAAYYGGFYDRLVMRVMDVFLAFPIILLAIGIIAMLGPNQWNTALAIGIVYTPIFARLVRGPALVLRESEYVQAAQALGASTLRVIGRHLLPNLASVILVQSTLSLSTAILVEASLSFLGLGTQPPTPSLGLMLSEGRAYLTLSPWTSVFSGLAILAASLGFNLLGDVLRDALDPRLKGR
ncbi:binding-protein-dependent transport systems inner membrane component [Allomeiothermus silvanus DSM 9946]|uniref:Binding-protein-dependent transport systems inner membrane component n=1 Tax=Allomeiothermus silvanus (strain ATCC 700542 / DSM 9946 / NBRC 106475 / NCIMB 13440 / VI-R2) TaxID=526227 RepID=D7BBH6_ALLS1|nr:ABC transporter permease [Allomeiothermus silvanus]ADH64438.1 binding-protein-dependent transport systems inner membrane component [Allomeiothermus silvanus DSM 9946]